MTRSHRPSSALRRSSAWFAAWLCCVGCLATACERQPDPKAAAAPKPFSLVVSADTAGWITPCGCASNQSGGMLRRGSYLADVRAAHGEALYVDAGGAAGGDSEYHRLRFEAILAGEIKLGLSAHNIGKSEAAMGPDYLRDVARRLSAPIVSANVRDAAGQPIADAARIAAAGGRRVAFVGVLSPSFATERLQVSDPRQAVLTAIAPLKGQYDALVVLAYLPQQELEALAASLPEADAVVGGPTGQSIAPRKVGPTVLAAATNKGKYVVRLTSDPSAGWGGEVAEISPALADHPDQETILRTYLADLDVRDLPATGTGLVPPVPANAPADYRIAGSESCKTCHEPDQTIWAHSKHHHAWETIHAKGFHVDSSCQQCHTTGFGLPGGFETRAASQLLVNVGCESCHGPSQAHVKTPTVRTPYVAADQCIRCHDQENSPAFNYEVYWPRTRHGQGRTPEPKT